MKLTSFVNWMVIELEAGLGQKPNLSFLSDGNKKTSAKNPSIIKWLTFVVLGAGGPNGHAENLGKKLRRENAAGEEWHLPYFENSWASQFTGGFSYDFGDVIVNFKHYLYVISIYPARSV